MEDRLQRQVILADSILYQAILTFIGQDIPSYVKGGWLLRKAWKTYDKTYREIRDLYDTVHGIKTTNRPTIKKSESKTSFLTDMAEDIPADIINRLLGAVSFGYGTFQLCISMVPPKVLKIIEFLGFEGERDVGLKCLECSCESQDMKAPLAA